MLCPRCQQTVSPTAVAPGVQQCTCGAFICDANVRRGIVAKDGVGDALWQQHLLAAPPSSVPCPSCTTLLRVVDYRGVEVDGCPSCGVLLLDPGELTALTGHAEPPPPISPSSSVMGGSPFMPAPLPPLELAREPGSRRANAPFRRGSSSSGASPAAAEVAYEMWWDCSACGTAALLGKSQRCCPNCGSPQDPKKRYFPPSGQEIVADGHQYLGADWSCAACQTPNGAAAAFCVNCGNPKDGNAAVGRVKDQVVKDGRVIDEAAVQAATTSRWSVRTKLVIAAVVAVVAILAAMLLIKHDVTVTVTQRTWTRAIDIERFRPQQDSAWCDQMPHDAYSVSRSREVRSHKSIPDGQDCQTRRVDRGDGTFTMKNECKTKYRQEPVYSDKCRYTVDRWGVDRTAGSSGTGITPRPVWPAVHLNGQRSGRGAEREGSRRAKNLVHLQSVTKAKDSWNCDFAEGRWLELTEGTRHIVKVNMLGMISCDTLSSALR